MPFDLLEPKEVDFPLPSGKKKTFILSKFTAVAGREIVCKYPLSSVPKLGDYGENETTMFKLMNFVAVKLDNGEYLRLSTPALIDNHCGNYEVLMSIELQMLEYNCSFFLRDRVSGFLNALAQKLPAKISEILTASLAALSQQEKPPSTNSAQSTP